MTMSEDPISLQPQIIEFVSQSKQLLKITNRTASTISNCFFCLFNTSKFQFSHENFTLNPWESKIITVSLLSKPLEYKQKEFAYIKSKNFSKRLTFICGSDNSSPAADQRMMRSPSSGVEDLYTLSSRDYRETQKAAYDRVIAEKQMYIKRLERRLQEQELSNRKDRSFTSDGKVKANHIRQIEQLQENIQKIQKQKEVYMLENKELLLKIKDLEHRLIRGSSKCEQIDEIEHLMSKKEQTINKLKEDIHYLQIQCESLYITISEKEDKIRKHQLKNSELISELIGENEKKLKELESKIDEDRKKSQRDQKGYKDKIKKLEQKLTQSQIHKNRKLQLEDQITIKENEMLKLSAKVEDDKKRKKQFEEQKKKSLKTHLRNQSLFQENNLLKSKIDVLEKSLDELREQTILYKSKVVDQEVQKASRYLQIALESCRNENQIIKKSKKQIEQSLNEQIRIRKAHQSKNRDLQYQIDCLSEKLQIVKSQKQRYAEQSRVTKDQCHEAIIKLRSENIQLIEKINFVPKKDENLQIQLKQSQIKLQKSEEEIKKIKQQSFEAFERLKQVEDQKLKMSRKIQKYKKQTTKQLKDITQSTLDELKKVKSQKKELKDRIVGLQKQLNETKQRQKLFINTKLDSTLQNIKNDGRTRYPATQSDRRTGIKNQKRQIEQTFHSCTRNEDIQLLYSELGELRQFKNYISIQMKKLKNLLPSVQEKINPENNQNLIFNCVNVFDSLRFKLTDVTIDRDKLLEAEKEVAYLRGRLIQLETVSKAVQSGNIDNTLEDKLSSIELVRNEGDRRLLQLVRQQMKNQYKKLSDSLLISQQKFDLLKRKIYEQYRARIIGMLNSKQKMDNISKINKIQAVLERFVQGLANKSHRDAILCKQVRLKQEARKQAGNLRQKVGFLHQIIQNKKSYCTRDPMKVYQCTNEQQWHDNIRLEAKLLTFQAQNTRLLEQLNLYQSQNKSFEEQIKSNLDDMEEKQNQIVRLKKQVVQISLINAQQLQKRQQDIEDLQKRFLKVQQQNFESESKTNQEKQLAAMRQQIDRKKDIIKNLKEKEKLLQQIIQSNRSSDSSVRNKHRKQSLEQIRAQQSLRQFKENNRELRNENTKLKEQIQTLRQQIQRKNVAIKRYRGEGEESRIRTVKNDSQQLERLRKQNKELNSQIKTVNSDIEKLKKKREKELLQLESQIKRLKNQNLIDKRSLQSIIRALCDCIKRLHSDLDITARKKGIVVEGQAKLEKILERAAEIDAIKVYEVFEQLLTALKN